MTSQIMRMIHNNVIITIITTKTISDFIDIQMDIRKLTCFNSEFTSQSFIHIYFVSIYLVLILSHNRFNQFSALFVSIV